MVFKEYDPYFSKVTQQYITLNKDVYTDNKYNVSDFHSEVQSSSIHLLQGS